MQIDHQVPVSSRGGVVVRVYHFFRSAPLQFSVQLSGQGRDLRNHPRRFKQNEILRVQNGGTVLGAPFEQIVRDETYCAIRVVRHDGKQSFQAGEFGTGVVNDQKIAFIPVELKILTFDQGHTSNTG